MFKKQWLCLLLAFACAFGCIGANAAEVDSDATYCFTQEDFSEEAGLRGICVTALPDAQAGTVMLGTRVIRVGDILTAEQVQKMTFLPLDTETDVTATITYLPIFQDRVEEAATMTISIRGKKNAAPVAQDQTLETYKNLPNSAVLKATDPEGSTLTFTVTRQPKRGAVQIDESGNFTYTPKKNKVGVDSFTYTATDPDGNVSREATVTVTILKPGQTEQYADTAGSDCRFEAEWLKNTGLFTGQQVNGQLIFDENAPMSQGQFLAVAVKLLGIPVDENMDTTVYGDDVANWLKPYLAAALRSGLTAGVDSFQPNDTMTGAHAAVMLQNALDLTVKVDANPDGKDDTAPNWASSAMAVMAENGIKLEDVGTMTRGEMAILLYQISKLAQDAPGLKMYQ
jgi:hypothetical protein